MIPTGVKVDHEYYVVELFNWPDIEVLDWCVGQFGKEGERWLFKFPNFYFANATDHLMFTIKWS
jgi:hypothetical protein